MNNLFLVAAVGMVLGGTLGSAQEKPADPGLTPASFTTVVPKAAYSAGDIKIVGTLDNGQSSKAVEYSSKPEYRAFVFEGNGNDQVEVEVTGLSGKAYVALADSTLSPIASGMGRLTATLPYHGPDVEAFYILFKGSENQPTRLVVHLKKLGTAPAAPADATR